MSNREVRALQNADIPHPTGPRPCPGRRRSSSLPPEVEPFNSTAAANRSPIPLPSLYSSIRRRNESIADLTYRDKTIYSDLEDTPIGLGAGTSGTNGTLTRSSEDEFTLPDNVNTRFEGLVNQVEGYSVDIINHVDWKIKVDTDFNSIDSQIQWFISKLSIVGNAEFVKKCLHLRSQLKEHRTSWKKRIHDEESNPVILRTNLSTRMEEVANEQSPANTLTHDEVFEEQINTLDGMSNFHGFSESLNAQNNTSTPPSLVELTRELIFPERIQHAIFGERANSESKRLDMKIENNTKAIQELAKRMDESEANFVKVTTAQGQLWSEIEKNIENIKIVNKNCVHIDKNQKKLTEKIQKIDPSSGQSIIRKDMEDLSGKIRTNTAALEDLKRANQKIISDSETTVIMVDNLRVLARENKAKLKQLALNSSDITRRTASVQSVATQGNPQPVPCQHSSNSQTPVPRGTTPSQGVDTQNVPQPTQSQHSNSQTCVLEQAPNPHTSYTTCYGEDPATVKIIEHNLRDLIQKIEYRIKVQVNKSSSEFLIKDCKLNSIPAIEKQTASLYALLQRYVKSPSRDEVLCTKTTDTIDSANSWIQNLTDLYNDMDLYSMDISKGSIAELQTFTGEGKQNIYEFLEDFDNMYKGRLNDKQKAEKMHRAHISERLKVLTEAFSSDFQGLRSYLIKEFGDYDTICDLTIGALEKIRKPKASEFRERSEYFTKLNSSLQKLQKLQNRPEINGTELKTHIYSRQFMTRLTNLMLPEDEVQFSLMLSRLGIDAKKMCGPHAYTELINFTQEMISALSRGAMRSESNPSKSTHLLTETAEQREDTASTHTTFTKGKESPKPARSPPPRWYNPDLTMPCPLEQHNHEIGTCTEFFSMTPGERREVSKYKVCWTCLGPRDRCRAQHNNKYGPCSNISRVKRLICKGCSEDKNLTKTMSPLNVLICTRKTHIKPSFTDIEKPLEDWIPKLNAKGIEKIVVLNANIAHGSHAMATCSCKNKASCECWQSSKTRPAEPNKPPVIVDTSTGKITSPGKDKIVQEIDESSFYIMQWIKIGNSDCLCFFDSGANMHLIDGALAEKEQLEVITQKPSTLSVVGGGMIDTQYGSYKLTIGPTTEGKYHELKCQGMSPLTSEFNTYPLKEVNEEVRSSKLVSTQEPLPDTTGGSVVHLLIGLKDPAIHPKLLGVLSSGLGVYRSPFKDKFGSRICYGGPHSLFSKTNKEGKLTTNHAVMHAIASHKESLIAVPYPIACEMGHPSDKDSKTMIIQDEFEVDQELGITVNPTPLTSEDFELAGCHIKHDPEWLDKVHIDSQEVTLTDHHNFHYCGVYKASIPISKLRQLVDEEDVKDNVPFRCPICAKCVKCKESGKLRAMSLQDSMEQEVINNSVEIDEVNCKVIVRYPWLEDPVAALTAKYKSKNNFYSARQVYNQVCNRKDLDRDALRAVHKDLVDKGFMVPLKSMPAEIQKKINEAEFQHAYAWRTAAKETSISTSLRIVVDPTMTGLNALLPKGENILGDMYSILIKNRLKPYAWSTDISKMYNRLHLHEDDYCFSLFLYDDSLDSSIEPEIWVMVVAWYGVVHVGNQAGTAIGKLVESAGSESHAAIEPLNDFRFVDDLFPGEMTPELREEQIKQCQNLLGKGGFSLKFVARSGEAPCEKSSFDGISIRTLGYTWATVEDKLLLSFSEINFNRKVRGARKPNAYPIVSLEDAEKLLSSIKLTRKHIASKVAEIYDPVGIWEPLKLQLKLELAGLNGLNWNHPLQAEDQKKWKNILAKFVDLSKLSVPRCVIPAGANMEKGARLLCLSDAAAFAGGSAVYVGFQLPDGNYSCQLLTAKSKIMDATVPRNELSAILLMTELAYVVSKALKGIVSEVIYVTDSTIALSWCHNTNKKLKLFVHNRVEAIRRMIEWTLDSKAELPLYHIDGERNIADLLTKKHDIWTDNVQAGSEWQNGYPWMTLPTTTMPLKRYSDLVLEGKLLAESSRECFKDPFMNVKSPESNDEQLASAADDSEIIITDALTLIDEGVIGNELYETKEPLTSSEESCFAIGHRQRDGKTSLQLKFDVIGNGWIKALKLLSHWIFFTKKATHILRSKTSSCKDCLFCTDRSLSDIRSEFLKEAELKLFQEETRTILETSSKDKLKKFVLRDEVLYYAGRLDELNPFTTKDLDLDSFFDNTEFTGFAPVVRQSSPLFFSYLVYVHTKVRPHAGVEITLREVMKKMFIMDNPRYVIRRVRSDCTKCKLILKKTIELEMSKHHFSRTMLSPPFYNCQVDIAYGFVGQSYKNARKTFKIYALVIVCLLTSATNILVLEGIETQDVVTALERHSARYGVPYELFVDNGSQLIALQSAEFRIRDVNGYLSDTLGIKISVSNAKAHEERGRVEAKIKTIRGYLEKSGVIPGTPMTTIQWETMFAKAANAIDDIPIAKGNSSNVGDLGYDILTPNRLKLGRNNFRSLEGSMDLSSGHLPSALLTRNRRITSTFLQLLVDRAHHLQMKPNKWLNSSEQEIKVDDIVLFVFTDSSKGKKGDTTWKIGKVKEVFPRKVVVTYASNPKPDPKQIPKMKLVERSPRDISVLFSENELLVNSPDYFTSLLQDKKNRCHE